MYCKPPSRLPAIALPLLAAALLASACGKKGDPLPPLRAIPAAVSDLDTRQQGWARVLDFGYPAITTSGTALGGIEKVEVLAMAQPLPRAGFELTPPEPRQFQLSARPLRVLAGRELDAATVGGRVVLTLPLAQTVPEPRQAHVYGVRVTSNAGEVSALSNLAMAVDAAPPEPPRNLTVVPRPAGIEVRWQAEAPEPLTLIAEPREEAGEGAAENEDTQAAPVADAEKDEAMPAAKPAQGPTVAQSGFHIYRRDASSRSYGGPVGFVDPEERTYTDGGARYGRRYIYTVTAVASRDPLVESRLSGEAEVAYLDRFAPAPPTELLALAETGRVRLRWQPGPDGDVVGYHIYRQGPAGRFVRLTRRPVEELTWVDERAVSGRSYVYRVTAIDSADNEGEPSAEVETTVR